MLWLKWQRAWGMWTVDHGKWANGFLFLFTNIEQPTSESKIKLTSFKWNLLDIKSYKFETYMDQIIVAQHFNYISKIFELDRYSMHNDFFQRSPLSTLSLSPHFSALSYMLLFLRRIIYEHITSSPFSFFISLYVRLFNAFH